MEPHAEYLSLGSNAEERCTGYRVLFLDAISDDRLDETRSYVQKQRALGTTRFQEAIEADLDRVATIQERGRPKKIVQP